MLESNRKDPVYLTGNAFQGIAKSFYIAIDNRDQETFYTLNNFLRERVSKSYSADNINSYEQFSRLFVWYYEYALQKISSTTYIDICKACAENSASALKDRLGWKFADRFFGDPEISIEEEKRDNEYSKIIINRFAELINICLRERDLPNFPFILNQLQQSYTSYNHKLSSLKIAISIKKSQRPLGEAADELAKLEEQYQVESFVDKAVRLLFKATLFWCYYLFQIDKLSNDQLSLILKEFEKYRGFINLDFVEDLLFLRNSYREEEFSWARWDYMIRPSGESYSPPNVQDWSTLGAFLYMLQTDFIFDMGTEEAIPEKIAAVEAFLDRMIILADLLLKNGFVKWGSILKLSDEAFREKIDLFKSRLSALQNSAIGAKERVIAQTPIDEAYTSNAKEILRNAWLAENPVRELFNHFGNIIDITDDEEKKGLLKRGFVNRRWDGLKTSLIRSEFHITMFGLENLGKQLADIEENVFLGKISKGAFTTSNLFLELNRSIDKIQEDGFHPSVIMCGYDIWRKYFSERVSADFIYQWGEKEFGFSQYGGRYKELPIVYFNSDLISDTVIVADFVEAFEMEQGVDPELFKNVLHLQIEDYSREDALGIINTNRDYWLAENNEEDAILRILNSVRFNFYLEEEFTIKKNEAYIEISVS